MTQFLNKILHYLDRIITGRATKILFFVYLLDTALWSYIVLAKYYSLSSSVFDLGFVMERLWEVYGANFSLITHISIIFGSAFQYVLSPLSLAGSLQLLLVFQVIVILTTVFPVYGISKIRLGSEKAALALSLTFLFYFPASGILWFDVHILAFFIPLFIWAYYFQIKGRTGLSLLFFILSATVKFPFGVIPFAYSFLSIVELKRNAMTSDDAGSSMRFHAIILLFTGILLAGGFYFDVLNSSIGSSIHTTGSIVNVLFLLATVVILFAPVLFLPLMKLKWFLLCIPIIFLAIYTGSNNYVFPQILLLQYPAMLVPPAFIGTIEALSDIKNNKTPKTIKVLAQITKHKVANREDKRALIVKISTIALIVTLLGSIFFQPYGVLNNETGAAFASDTSVNLSRYADLNSLLNLIPRNDPYVVIQNNMPEAFPRPLVANQTFLFPAYFSSNISLENVINNKFPIESMGNRIVTGVDYLIADTQSKAYYTYFGSGEHIFDLITLMIDSGKYGVLAEANGMIVLERAFTGPLKIFKPLSLTIPFAGNQKFSQLFQDASIVSRNYTSDNCFALLPGTYNFRVNIQASNSLSSNSMNISLRDQYSGILISKQQIRPYKILTTPTGELIEYSIQVPNQFAKAYFQIEFNSWSGSFGVYSLNLQQISPDLPAPH